MVETKPKRRRRCRALVPLCANLAVASFLWVNVFRADDNVIPFRKFGPVIWQRWYRLEPRSATSAPTDEHTTVAIANLTPEIERAIDESAHKLGIVHEHEYGAFAGARVSYTWHVWRASLSEDDTRMVDLQRNPDGSARLTIRRPLWKDEIFAAKLRALFRMD